ncbi:unnamed protein product [Fraxinus pennsylvanica]|uniref:Uncharacterized protein n=1 Tax=Fraxinus pennsylvanica TaxID=56036 RepID=A0AAD2DZP1_9LAMI|nr:unnamed protein product [Fraxinus pennsylvanica]
MTDPIFFCSFILWCEHFGTREIRDRVFDDKANTVTVTVICCFPEKIRDKLCSKGGKFIKSIEIKEPPMLKPEEPGKPKEPEKTESKCKGNAPPLAASKPEPLTNPAHGPPVGLPPVHPVNPCCGPCYHGYGFPPQPCCDGNYACGRGYVYGRPPCCVARRCDYFSEENATGCTIM